MKDMPSVTGGSFITLDTELAIAEGTLVRAVGHGTGITTTTAARTLRNRQSKFYTGKPLTIHTSYAQDTEIAPAG